MKLNPSKLLHYKSSLDFGKFEKQACRNKTETLCLGTCFMNFENDAKQQFIQLEIFLERMDEWEGQVQESESKKSESKMAKKKSSGKK